MLKHMKTCTGKQFHFHRNCGKLVLILDVWKSNENSLMRMNLFLLNLWKIIFWITNLKTSLVFSNWC